ncbi:MAG TPA: DUF2071 domain-containing protein [Tepidisphaeraceae bacterium]|nr:DUF2071 domain-containing protein [Tepidisphaeraceae bacterium]
MNYASRSNHTDASNRPFQAALVADWDDVAFVHFAIPPELLRPLVPFELDLFVGQAFVSLVAFTQRRLRPRLGGRIAAALSAPLASHEFLNVRTYVRHRGEPGIHFLCEWIPNRLATWLGPPLYGLPYRLGRLVYRYDRCSGECFHDVSSGGSRLEFDVFPVRDDPPGPAPRGTLDEFLLERYVAFTRLRGRNACFRVEHVPWARRQVAVRWRETGLLETLPLPWDRAQPMGGHYSEGVRNVGLGPPVLTEAAVVPLHHSSLHS